MNSEPGKAEVTVDVGVAVGVPASAGLDPKRPPRSVLQLLRWPRLYWSTWVFLFFLTAILTLANLPGEEVGETRLDTSDAERPWFRVVESSCPFCETGAA